MFEPKIVFIVLLILYFIIGFIIVKKRFFILDEMSVLITCVWPLVILFDKLENRLPYKLVCFIEIVAVFTGLFIIGLVYSSFFNRGTK
jgi:hypothetical protein